MDGLKSSGEFLSEKHSGKKANGRLLLFIPAPGFVQIEKSMDLFTLWN
jgi:hypothetical protein